MDFEDRPSTPVFEEKTFDETTIFISENGSGTKRRRRKSLGRRVSFAEAPKLHIFPRDDEYETPTRGTTGAAAGSPSSGGKRRSPRIATRVVDDDKENRALDVNPISQRGRRGRASKPLAAKGAGSPALKPQNWLDERDSSEQAGNDDENTGPVDLRHLSSHTKESELDEENLTLDSTTFALKFNLHRNKNGQFAVVQSNQNSSAAPIVEAFADENEVLENDMSFTINGKPLRKRSLSELHEGVGEMTGEMSFTVQDRLADRLASVNTSLDDDPVIASEQEIRTTGTSSLPGSTDDNSAPVIHSNNADNGPVQNDPRIPGTVKSSLPRSKDDNSALFINSNNAEESPVPVSLSVDVLAQIEERFGRGLVDDDDDDDDNINPNEGRPNAGSAELEAAFGPGFAQGEIHRWVPATRKTALPSSTDDKPIEEALFAGVDSPPTDLDVGSADRSISELQTGSDMVNPAEEAEMILSEPEFTGVDTPVKDVDLSSTEMESKGVRETLNLIDEAELSGVNRPRKDLDVGSTDRSCSELQTGGEMVNPAEEAEMMLREAEFTGAESSPKDVNLGSTAVIFSELQRTGEVRSSRKSLDMTEEADLMLREEEFTGILLPKNIDVRWTDVGCTEFQRVRETQRPAPDTKMGAGKYTVSEPDHPEGESGTIEEMRGALVQAETGVTEIEVQRGSEIDKLHMQEIKDTPCSPEIGYIMTTDVLSRIPGGEELQSSISANDAELCLEDEPKESSHPLRDPGAGALDARMRALQSVQESQRQAQVTPGKRMPIAAFQQPGKGGILDSPATTNGSESPGQNSDNRAIKRTKFLRNMSSGDTNDFSPTLERVTAQVPRLSDLLAADMDSALSTPVRPMRRSMWMTPPASVTASRSKVVKVSNREREDDTADSMSIFDLSMEIVEDTADPIRHSLHKSGIQAVEEAPTPSDGQAPERFLGRNAEDVPILTIGKEKGVEPDSLTRETMDPVQIPKIFQEKENAGLIQRVPLQLLKTTGKDPEQDRPALREITYPAHILGSSRGNDCELDTLGERKAMDPPHIILRTSREENEDSTITSAREKAQDSKNDSENECIQDTSGQRDSTTNRSNTFSAPHQEDVQLDSLPNPRQTVTLEVTENQQSSLATKQGVDRSQILSIPQPKESEKGILMNRNLGVESQEKGDGHDDTAFVKEAAHSARVTRTSTEEDQCSPSSPRTTGSAAQLITAVDLDKRHENNYFHKPDSVPKPSDDKPTIIQEDRIQEGEGGSVSVPKISVEEFLQLAKVQFSRGLRSVKELLDDPSSYETHHVRSLSECFSFLCLIQPQLQVLEDACGVLYGDIDNFTAAIEELEERLTANNPPIFSYFQNSREREKQRIRNQIERIQENCMLFTQKNIIRFRQGVEREYNRRFLHSKNTVTYYVGTVREKRNSFDDMCQRPFRLLQANLSSRYADQECTSTPAPKVSKNLSQEGRITIADVRLRTTFCLEKIEYLKEQRKDLKSSMELKLAKLSQNKQAAEDILRGKKAVVQVKKNNLAGLCSQVVDKVCSGKKSLRREEVSDSLQLYVQKMIDEVYLLQRLQDGFQLKSNGTENQDQVFELSYRSLLKRRYVVRKVGTAVKVLRSSWVLVPKNIEATFPQVNALSAFSLATTTTGCISKESATNSTASTQIFGRLSALEAVRFTLPSLESRGIPEPTSLRASMQVSRILVGNLIDLMEEVGKCQLLVNTACGGGVLAEPLFRNAPDGELLLEHLFIDCVSSIKFFVNLDMSCLPLIGYPLGDLPAKVEIAFCAPKTRPRFKRESLEDLLSRVEPGYKRLVRIYSAVGAFLGSVRSGE